MSLSNLFLSTTLCRVPAAPATILSQWYQARAQVELVTLAADSRLPLPVQSALLHEAAAQRLFLKELSWPQQSIDRKTIPSPLSNNGSEQQAAADLLKELVWTASVAAPCRVMLYPFALPLRQSLPLLRHRFHTGLRLALNPLLAERQRHHAVAIDRLCRFVDAALVEAAYAQVELTWLLPGIWPHYFPDISAALQLQHVFAGAPLQMAWATDWHHAAQSILRTADTEELAQATRIDIPDGIDAWRFADACGLTLRLPLGSGEIDWSQATAPLKPDDTITLTLDQHVTPAEVQRSVDLLLKA